MREVWKHKIGWDDMLPEYVYAAWDRWMNDIPKVTNIEIPRHYFRNGPPKELQLHTFVDASEEAFAAVSFWRSISANCEIEVAFVSAKTRCAPLKMISVPRLELQAAVLGVRMMRTIIQEHPLETTYTIWSDSKTVLRWINSTHRRFKPFVAHRIAEILASTKASNWKWVPTAENVADEATRAKYRVEFTSTSRWLKGPKFLWNDSNSWPDTPASESEDVDEEVLPYKFGLLSVSRSLIKFERFSSYNKLKRSMAWVLRFIDRCRNMRGKIGNALTAIKLRKAEYVLCRQAQSETYSSEISQIENHICLKKGSELYTLSPYIDDEGVIRSKGRIDVASCLPYESRRPIILPPKHPLSKLLVFHYHNLMKHSNHEATICEIRRRFWIPGLRRIVRNVNSNCNVCKIRRAEPRQPVMGPLPEDRCSPFIRPFSYVGLDYFGPIQVTIGRRTEKRWVALFTCLTVRAIHLEVAADLSTDACIIVLRNFMNRRGTPVRIRSDNGKNFVGADQVAKRISDVFDCNRLQDELSSKGVEWLFNCPSNPSAGGAWERMVQCTKRVLSHTLKEVAPREHTLQSFIIEAENVVNSRPLTHLPVTIDQAEPLTPNHFLLGSPNTAQTPGTEELTEKPCVLRKQWRIARQLRDRFWKRWVMEYLPTLTRRTKWCQPTKPLKEGDLVFICDINLPRKQWSRGKVERVYRGADGEIRSADVRTKTGMLRRPTSKLAVLELDESESPQPNHGGGNVTERPRINTRVTRN